MTVLHRTEYRGETLLAPIDFPDWAGEHPLTLDAGCWHRFRATYANDGHVADALTIIEHEVAASNGTIVGLRVVYSYPYDDNDPLLEESPNGQVVTLEVVYVIEDGWRVPFLSVAPEIPASSRHTYVA